MNKSAGIKISEIEALLEELGGIIKKKDDEISDLKEEVGEWKDHECECDCEDEIVFEVKKAQVIPIENLEDERKVALLSANWHNFSYSQLYSMLDSNIPNMLPPSI